MKIVVYHSYYGCDTGCCGHTVLMIPSNLIQIPEQKMDLWDYEEIALDREFEFDHPDKDGDLQWAKDLVEQTYGKKHVADLDWDNCLILED